MTDRQTDWTQISRPSLNLFRQESRKLVHIVKTYVQVTFLKFVANVRLLKNIEFSKNQELSIFRSHAERRGLSLNLVCLWHRLTRTLLRCLYDAVVDPCGDDAGRLLSTTVRLLRQPEMDRYDCRLGRCAHHATRPHITHSPNGFATSWETSTYDKRVTLRCQIDCEWLCIG